MKPAIWLGLAVAVGAWAQNSVIEKAVDPQWEFRAGEAVMSMPMWVSMTVLEDGTPWEVESEAALPIPLMHALEQYQMRANRSAYRVGFTVETRQLASEYKTDAGGWPANLGGLLAGVDKLNAKKAADAEKKLADDASSLEQRSQLVVWAARQTSDEAMQMRARQLVWLIEHQPEAEVLRSNAAWIDPQGSGAAAYAQVREAWIKHFNAKPARPFAIGAAAMFLRFGDPQIAEDLLKSGAPISNRAMPTLGELYVYGALGVRGLAPGTLFAAVPADPQPGEFGTKARAALASATDARLLMAARTTLVTLGRNPLAKIADYELLCETITAQLKSVLPDAPTDCVRPKAPAAPGGGAFAGAPAGGGGGGGRGGGGGGRGGGGGGGGFLDFAATPSPGAFGPQVKKEVKPVLSAKVQEKKYKGRVSFSAVVGKDGALKQIQFLGGPLPLAVPAYEAVAQYQYTPVSFGGQTIESPTTVNVDFK